MAEVILGKGRVRPVWAGHPWVYAQAVKTLRGAPAAGDPVRVLDESGRFLGSGGRRKAPAVPREAAAGGAPARQATAPTRTASTYRARVRRRRPACAEACPCW